MKKSIPLAVLAAAVAFGACKHQEHPKENSEKEHPEHPSGMKFDLKKEFTAAVSDHVREAAGVGAFQVQDESLRRGWDLSLVRIHSDKIVKLGGDSYFACADFKENATGKIVDLDFYATRSGEDWTIKPALIHKVEGKPRFTYNDKNERVPVQAL